MLNKLKPLASIILDRVGMTRMLSSGWRVLMYHRILDPEKSKLSIQAGMYVRPETFRMQMQFLAKNCNVMVLDDLVQAVLKKEKLPKRSVAITFDDGWVDNYECAFPILKELSLPATVFIPTAYIGSSKLFWTDKLAVLSLLFREQNAEVEFSSDNPVLEQSLKKLFDNNSNFNKLLEESITELKKTDLTQRLKIISMLQDFLQFDPERLIPPQFLSWQQIKQMQEHKIRFGSHSHSHLQLADCQAAEIKQDLEISLSLLSINLKNPSKIFCYPEGSYNEISQAILAQLPIEAVVSNKWVKLKAASPSITSLAISSLPIIGRIGIHQDISARLDRFKNRIWCEKLF